jgi:ATP-binding cassette subfamily B protein
MQDLRSALYSHLQRMPLRFFTETKTGEIQSRLANDVGGIQGVVTDTAASITSNVATAVSTMIAMLLIDWRLTALSLGLLPFFIFVTFKVGQVRRTVSSETQKTLAEISAVTEETLSVSGMLLSKTFGQQAASVSRYREVNARLAGLQIRQAMVGRWFFMVIGTIFSITPAFVYWLAGTLGAAGDPNAPTAGTIVAFTTLQSRLFFPLGQLLNVQVEIQGSLALFDRIFEYLEMDPEIVDAPDAVALRPRDVRGRVRFRKVSFRYPTRPIHALGVVPAAAEESGGLDETIALDAASDTEAAAAVLTTEAVEAADAAVAEAAAEPAVPSVAPIPRRTFALHDLDFEVRPGQLVALVGPSGSGKTTSTYLIPRLYDVDEGSVEIDEHDVRKVTLASLGDVIGFVTQETYLFHNTIRENLRYARPDASDAELEAATTAAAIHDRIMELPQGYDTTVGERGYKLSGGEKQRIAIARVLLKDPRILILDEATSALDTVSERLIQAALERVMEGRTTIAIAHRLSTILAADLILVYQRGRIVERGTHAELLAEEGLYARLYREQFLSATGADEPGAARFAVAGTGA